MVWSFDFQAALGSYVSSQVLMALTRRARANHRHGHGKSSGYMSVRCYVDEILIP